MKKFFVLPIALLLLVSLVTFEAFGEGTDSNDTTNNGTQILQAVANAGDADEAQPVGAGGCCNRENIAEGSFARPQLRPERKDNRNSPAKNREGDN
ncbi:MAG: hypothetical protein V4760_00685 [Bdellovibrionota bacterium]